jgi:hypothetical protein
MSFIFGTADLAESDIQGLSNEPRFDCGGSSWSLGKSGYREHLMRIAHAALLTPSTNAVCPTGTLIWKNSKNKRSICW